MEGHPDDDDEPKQQVGVEVGKQGDGADGVEGNEQQDAEGAAAVCESHLEEPVVNMPGVGLEGAPTGEDATEDHFGGIKQWHDEHREREYHGEGGGAFPGGVGVGELHREVGHEEADGERTGVAHKDLLLLGGVAVHVEVKERDEHAESDERHDGMGIHAEVVKDEAVKKEGEHAHTQREPVDPVDEVDGVHDKHDLEEGERDAHGGG